ncbi:MAG TPA: hypothetical protein VGF19_00255 [Candidatus Acidoferrum sp.]|jgi:hypothetical protein
MKTSLLLKMCVVFVGVGAGMLFAPTCRAQAEVSPDHFEGADAATAPMTPAKSVTAQAKQNPTLATRNPQKVTVQHSAKHESGSATADSGAAVADKRKTAAVLVAEKPE